MLGFLNASVVQVQLPKTNMGPPIVTKLTSDFVWQRFEIKKNEKDPHDLSKVICTL